LLNGATKLAYEIGENKSKGGESPYARHLARRHGRECRRRRSRLQACVSADLEGARSQLAKRIIDKIEDVEKFVKVKDMEERRSSRAEERRARSWRCCCKARPPS